MDRAPVPEPLGHVTPRGSDPEPPGRPHFLRGLSGADPVLSPAELGVSTAHVRHRRHCRVRHRDFDTLDVAGPSSASVPTSPSGCSSDASAPNGR